MKSLRIAKILYIYATLNPFIMKKITNKELEQLLASDLTDIIHTITDFPHRITYYGNLSHS